MTIDDRSPPQTSPGVLVLPRLRVQNANAISSPLTWGFPAITAFAGFMTALERRLGPDAGLAFRRVGVVCHGFEPQVTRGGYVRTFHLTRNPVLADGSTAAIVEEGRVHLDVTLVFDVDLQARAIGTAERAQLAGRIADLAAGMRLAGGSVMPPLAGVPRHATRPWLQPMPEGDDGIKEFRRLRRRWLPGFALVSRDDLLQARLAELRQSRPDATPLDAWLDLSRMNHRAVQIRKDDPRTGQPVDTVEWQTDRRAGWLVPVPVGFAALSGPHAPGTVSGTRDPSVPFTFVESVYSVGQWVSPHRLNDLDDLLWQSEHRADKGLYRCFNGYRAPETAV